VAAVQGPRPVPCCRLRIQAVARVERSPGTRACLPWGPADCRALLVDRLAAYRVHGEGLVGARFRAGSLPGATDRSSDSFESESFPRVSLSSSKFLRLPPWTPCRPTLSGPSYVLSCRGSCPLRDITGSVHTRGGSHLSASFRPRAFSAPRRLAPLSASRASFIPLPRPGFLTVQGFLPLRSPPGSSPFGAPLPFPPARSPPDCSFGCHVRASRLRGLDPRTGAFISDGV